MAWGSGNGCDMRAQMSHGGRVSRTWYPDGWGGDWRAAEQCHFRTTSRPGRQPGTVVSNEVSAPQGDTREGLIGQRPGILMGQVSGLNPSLFTLSLRILPGRGFPNILETQVTITNPSG